MSLFDSIKDSLLLKLMLVFIAIFGLVQYTTFSLPRGFQIYAWNMYKYDIRDSEAPRGKEYRNISTFYTTKFETDVNISEFVEEKLGWHNSAFFQTAHPQINVYAIQKFACQYKDELARRYSISSETLAISFNVKRNYKNPVKETISINCSQ